MIVPYKSLGNQLVSVEKDLSNKISNGFNVTLKANIHWKLCTGFRTLWSTPFGLCLCFYLDLCFCLGLILCFFLCLGLHHGCMMISVWWRTSGRRKVRTANKRRVVDISQSQRQTRQYKCSYYIEALELLWTVVVQIRCTTSIREAYGSTGRDHQVSWIGSLCRMERTEESGFSCAGAEWLTEE